MRSAITFDFHNTLIRCDPWFDLEVSGLPAIVAGTLWASGRTSWSSVPPAQDITNVYRSLRAEIIAHGNEMDAVSGVMESFRRLGLDADKNAVTEIVDHTFRELVDVSTVMSGVRHTLEHLNGLGIRIGVVSSAVHHDFLEWTLSIHGLRRYFAEIVTSASTGFYKSRPEIYYSACELLGVAPASTIHVGDSFRFDHLGGIAAGLQTVWINDSGSDGHTESPRPSLELTSLVDGGPPIHQLLLASCHAD
jgi:HAD superfamily hydrolase (TIGR01549 family)